MNDHEKLDDHTRIELLKQRIEHCIAIVESERGTLSRTSATLRSETKSVDEKYQNILYNKGSGLAFMVDRLVQSDKERRENNNWIKGIIGGLIVAVTVLIFKTFIL